jgi:hypothetical protein
VTVSDVPDPPVITSVIVVELVGPVLPRSTSSFPEPPFIVKLLASVVVIDTAPVEVEASNSITFVA